MEEWNDSGRVVKKGKKATRSRRWFDIEQNVPFDLLYTSKKNGKIRRIFFRYRKKKSQLRDLTPSLSNI